MEALSREEAWVLEEKYAGHVAPGFEEDRRRLARGEPAAYVIGHQPFLGLTIYLDSHPLIPRPETEWWTEKLITLLSPSSEPLSFLDLCAGSGAIGCAALARLPEARVYFSELDPAHEATIYKNIRENGLDESRAHIGIGDLFAPFSDLKFDVIAANPPYIPSGRALPESVAGYEPHPALFAGEDGLALIRRIAKALPKHLTERGSAWIECDASHAEAALEIFRANGFSGEIMHDQFGKPRVLVLSFA
ncbi:MAG TPA: peptide chain release factor N(5)-glutamine methyltransferase [Candidatus Paceibacterota bacterium]|nr:peptide chain release factor N(5)-glutamine methyltransferase [Candidatus Paceibacterota bacterium]